MTTNARNAARTDSAGPEAVAPVHPEGTFPGMMRQGQGLPRPRPQARGVSMAPLLRTVPMLTGLSDELLERAGNHVTQMRVRAGDWVFHEGDAADSMFVIGSGRLEVIDEGPPQTLIRVLRRGDVLGELALLRESTRSASVRALRDATLLELSRAGFEDLIRNAPSFALGLTRALGAQLAASRSPITTATPPRTIAVVALNRGLPGAWVARRLSGALSEYGSVTTLTAGDIATIDRAERASHRVVLDGATARDDEWEQLCVREADLVVAVTSGTPDAIWRERAAALSGCELVVFAPGVSSTVLEELKPRAVQVVAETARRAPALEAIGRRLAGRSLGVVFSGGGARAFAHLGVLEELRAAGLRIDRVAGVSLGALVAGAAAAGFPSEVIYAKFRQSFASSPANDFVPPAYSLVRGAKTRRLLKDAFGDRRIEELPLRFFCLSCDLISREVVTHRTGILADAIYASLAIPGVFPPVVAPGGRLLVDGGVLDNLPVAAMAGTGEGPVIAVDVTGRTGQPQHTARSAVPGLGRLVRRALTGSDARIPRLTETMLRTVTVGSIDTAAAARLHAALVISPRVDGIGLTEWKKLSRARESGRAAARAALAAAGPDVARRLGL